VIRFFIRWAFRLFVLAIVLVVAFVLSFDSLMRVFMEHRIRAQTGMDAEIGRVSIGLLEPRVEILDLKLFNPPDFGGTPFLNIPEIHVEYDRPALSQGIIHLTLLRFNLGELDVVKSRDGQTNLLSLGLALPAKQSAGPAAPSALADFKQQTGYEFKGVDCLNVSVGTFKYLDLQNQKNNREQNIGIENCVLTNVTSKAALVGLGVLVGLRSDDFFRPFVDPQGSGSGQSPSDLLKMLGH